MNGQQVCVAIHHTERTYSPHRPDVVGSYESIINFPLCIRC